MKTQGLSKDEKLKYLNKIIMDLKREDCKRISIPEIKSRFKGYGMSIYDRDFKMLNIRQILIENNILPNNLKKEEKQYFFKKLLRKLKNQRISELTNTELIQRMNEDFGVKLADVDIIRLGFRELLEENGIHTSKHKSHVREVLDKTIEHVLANKITIDNIKQLHDIAKDFGSISRGSVDLNIDYIQRSIDIKHIKSSKKIQALDLSDEDIIIEVAKYYTKENVFSITGAEFRKRTSSKYRTVDIEVIRKYAGFLNKNYNIELVGQNPHISEESKHNVDEIVTFLDNKKNKYSVLEVDVLDEESRTVDSFVVNKSLKTDLSNEWELYLNDYIKWLAKLRVNVHDGLISDCGDLKIDTEKKKLLTLNHQDLDIKKMTFSKIVKLTQMKFFASQKAYGIHMQNMYIGFLLFLHAKKKIIFPFSYVFDVCYSARKVQAELQHYLLEHSINKKLEESIKENRLTVKDDKYKRIFQFFLLTLPRDFPIERIEYKHLVPLLKRSKDDFRRVRELLNTLGASIIDEKPKLKYVDRYIKYSKISKYQNLVEIFNKAMNRAYKLGNYAKEKSIYKDWSLAYADFFDFLETNYTNESFSESFLCKIFDYPEEENILTYQEYVQNLKMSQSAKDKKFTPLIAAFSESKSFQSLNDIKSKKPVFDNTSENNETRKKRGAIKSFVALAKIEDILRNRPPKSDYYKKLNIDKQYTDWWVHYDEVAPFEPLILLMHLYIPARGINFRLADRNSFLVKNESGVVTGYHFTHDKNKKRKTPYIAPNIWGDDLKIIENFVEYSRIHFPYQKAIKYDKQNPNGIVPLFPNAKGTNFYTEGQHMSYWKRVLLKAQIELNNEGNVENIMLVYQKNSTTEIPKKSEDVDKLLQAEMDNFNIRYDLHSLRHTGATKYANAGMPLGLLKLLTGHIDLNVLQMVYIEIDEARMIQSWNELHHVDLDGFSIVDAGSNLINHIKKETKEILLENNPEKLLEFLEQGKYLTIGSYLGSNDLVIYSLEDFSKIDPVFWTFKRVGICTSSTCPQGLENRCSLCPHFLTSPAYMQEISAQVNLQNYRLSKYVNMVVENRKNGNPENNLSIRTSAQLELEEMLGWTEILKALDEIRTVIENEQNIDDQSSLVDTARTHESLFKLAPIKNGDHSLLKLVYDGLALKQFDHESMQDASEKLIAKLIRYAAKNGKFAEIDGKGKYEIFEWFKPVYNEVLLLEKDAHSQEKLSNILSFLSDKPLIHSFEQNSRKQVTNKEEK